jgi:acetyl esterase/lipase
MHVTWRVTCTRYSDQDIELLQQTRKNSSLLDIDPTSISIGGISAGAHLACVIQHRARDEGIMLRLLVAAVPPLADHDIYKQPSDSPWPSYSEYKDAPMLNWERMAFFREHAFPAYKVESTRKKIPAWWISPLRAPNFENLCDTFLATAEGDMLRDEGEEYGKMLLEGGNKVVVKR